MVAIAYPSTIGPEPSPAGAGAHRRPDLRVVAGRAHRSVHPTAATYRRRRLTALVVAVVVVAALVVAARWAVADLGGGPDPAPEITTTLSPHTPISANRYVVQPGDTVWRIARKLKPSGDVRAVVDRIVARNGTATLQPGQTLLLD